MHFDISNLSYAFLAVGIVFIVFSLMFCCLVFKNFKHIKTAIAIFDASADFAVNHIRLVVFVFFYFIFLLMSFILWFFVIMYVMSLNDIGTKPFKDGAYYKYWDY